MWHEKVPSQTQTLGVVRPTLTLRSAMRIMSSAGYTDRSRAKVDDRSSGISDAGPQFRQQRQRHHLNNIREMHCKNMEKSCFTYCELGLCFYQDSWHIEGCAPTDHAWSCAKTAPSGIFLSHTHHPILSRPHRCLSDSIIDFWLFLTNHRPEWQPEY